MDPQQKLLDQTHVAHHARTGRGDRVRVRAFDDPESEFPLFTSTFAEKQEAFSDYCLSELHRVDEDESYAPFSPLCTTSASEDSDFLLPVIFPVKGAPLVKGAFISNKSVLSALKNTGLAASRCRSNSSTSGSPVADQDSGACVSTYYLRNPAPLAVLLSFTGPRTPEPLMTNQQWRKKASERAARRFQDKILTNYRAERARWGVMSDSMPLDVALGYHEEDYPLEADSASNDLIDQPESERHGNSP